MLAQKGLRVLGKKRLEITYVIKEKRKKYIKYEVPTVEIRNRTYN